MTNAITILREQLKECSTEVEQLKKTNYESQRLLQYVYDQLQMTNQKLLEDNKNQVSSLTIFVVAT